MSVLRRSAPVLSRVALALAAVVLLGVPAQAAGQKSFKDWMVVCDNLNTCVAFVFPTDPAEQAWLRLERAGDADAPVRLTIVVSAEEQPGAGGEAWALTVDGKAIPGLGQLKPVEDDTGFWRADIPADQARAVALAARDGAVMGLTRRGRAPVVLPLSGGAATMIWIDEQQNRLGSPTALSKAPGPSPVVVAAMPIRVAGPAVPQGGLPTAVPPSVMTAIGECETQMEPAIDPIIARLAPGVVLYAPVCSRGAYNAIYSLVLADERGGGVRVLQLPLPAGFGQTAIGDPMNIDYNPETRMLTSFAKGRGLGDCGDETQWVWDGRAFQVVVSRVMGDCRGVPFDDWPTLFQGQVQP